MKALLVRTKQPGAPTHRCRLRQRRKNAEEGSQTMRAIIVGGGIGGLTAAIALRQTGWSVQVIERAEQFGEVGAGVQLGPNATRVLKRLGLGEQLDQIAVAPEAVRFLRWADDAVLAEWPLTELLRRFGAPYYTLYRPDLIEILAATQPSEDMTLGTEVTDVSATPAGAAVSTADGTRLEADLVLGCDGTHSTVRSCAIGDVPARFSGMCRLPGGGAQRWRRADGAQLARSRPPLGRLPGRPRRPLP